MVASQGMQMSNWKNIRYTLQVSLLCLTDRLINFKSMGTYCEKNLEGCSEMQLGVLAEKPILVDSQGFKTY